MVSPNHPLRLWLRSRGEKAEDLVASLPPGVIEPRSLDNIMSGFRHPSRDVARAIEAATGGEVSAAELLLWERAEDADAEPELRNGESPDAPEAT